MLGRRLAAQLIAARFRNRREGARRTTPARRWTGILHFMKSGNDRACRSVFPIAFTDQWMDIASVLSVGKASA